VIEPVSVRLDRDLVDALIATIVRHNSGSPNLTGHELAMICFSLASVCGWLIGMGYHNHPDALFTNLIAGLNDQIWAQVREAQREQRAAQSKPQRRARAKR